MAGIENDVLVAKNVNFDFTSNPPHNGIVTSDGQLLIGSTANPNIAMVANTLTAGTGITITNAPGSITIASTASQTDLHTAQWIVNSEANGGGNCSTIQTAIDQAASGETIFIMPGTTGTYTENLTLKAGVNLVSFVGAGLTPNVTIIGNLTFASAGTVSISGMRLQTNGAACLTVSGNAASIVNLDNCYINCSNATGISFTSSSASARINITNCVGNLGTTGIGLFSQSSAGSLVIRSCDFSNTGGSSTASTCSAGLLNIFYSNMASPITTSGTGAVALVDVSMDTSTQNTTSLTHGGASSFVRFCAISSGTASSVSTSASLTMESCVINSSNANAITGAGTLVASNLQFQGASNTINVTTQSPLISRSTVNLSRVQPAFLGYLAATVLNKTGTGGIYTLGTDALTEVYDQANNFTTAGVFTAPYTGLYLLTTGILCTGCTAATNSNVTITTTSRSYVSQNSRAASAANINSYLCILANMTAGDTATASVSVTGEAGVTVDVFGDANASTFFSGCLIC